MASKIIVSQPNLLQMKKKGVKLSTVLLLGLGLTGLQAQESINSSGGNAKSSSGSTSYSIGQLTYQTHSNANGAVSQGVQMSFEIQVVTSIDELQNISLSAFPNPTTTYLDLVIDNEKLKNFSYQLFDMNGLSLLKAQIDAKETRIKTDQLSSAYYFLKVMDGNKEIKTFKIIKH